MSDWTEGQIWLADGDDPILGTDKPIRFRVDLDMAEVEVDRSVEWKALDVTADRVVVTDLNGEPLVWYRLGSLARIDDDITFVRSVLELGDTGE